MPALTPERMRKLWAEVSGTVLSRQIADFGELVADDARRGELERAEAVCLARMTIDNYREHEEAKRCARAIRALIEEPKP